MTRDAWMLSSAGRRGSLVHLLRQTPIHGRQARVVATDVSDLSAAGHLADVFERVPRVTAGDFVEQTLDVALRNRVAVIIPTIDPEIEVFAANRHVFEEQGISVWVSTPDVARLGWDKWMLYRWLREHALPTVETIEITAAGSARMTGPVVAKPRNGSSGIGVVFADCLDALHRDDLGDDYIVQERAPGFEVTVDFAVGKRGGVLAVVPRRRLEVRGGEVSKGVTVDFAPVIDVVRTLIAHLGGAYGALNVQVFYQPATGTVNIIEINPRFGGGYPLSHLSGANFFDALLRDAAGDDVGELRWEPGTLMLRYDAEVIVKGFDVGGLDD